ncbi:hypothetical protein E5676_scaffold299G00280 [Cucumis melo var. makuwa]|uniref:Uncharacterized protein n=1 Tax=Cucumis melo var. makuwa TaxID=1194695 RepID=A0A5D3CQ87_CUCMM|nr:hypothetical protein E5676_scaffold299G00280 [Cucumis melo var. makuwa]
MLLKYDHGNTNGRRRGEIAFWMGNVVGIVVWRLKDNSLSGQNNTEKDLVANCEVFFMESLEKFHGAVLVLLLGDALRIAVDTRKEGDDATQFVPE